MKANDVGAWSGIESHLGRGKRPPPLGLTVLGSHILGKSKGWWKIAEPIASYFQGGISIREVTHGMSKVPLVNQTTG